MPDPLVLDDFMAPTGFANPLHLDELRRPVPDSVRAEAVRLADLLMAMVPLREALPVDLPRARDRPAAAGVDKYALLAAWRREAGAGFDALLARGRPEARLATQAAILEVIAQRTAPLLERPRELLSRRWRRFERGCFLAALTHWSRERAAIKTRGAIPPDVGANHRRALAARHKTEPWVRLFLAARRQFAAHQLPSDPAESAAAMARDIAMALNLLCAAHANLPRLTPPLIQRSLRAMHREMLGAVSESFGLLEMLRRLRMDFPTPARLAMVRCPRLPRLRDHPKNAAAPAPPDPATRTTADEERERRNAALGEMFDAPLRPLPPPPSGDAPDLCPGAERLADLLPPAERIVLGYDESRSASAGDLKRAEPSLTNLWGWFLEHRAYGYPRLGRRGGDADPVTPERYWIKLLDTISLLYDGLGSAGFRAAGDLDDYPSHINVQTYIGHGAYSCDVHIALGTPVRMARPATLAVTARAIGPAFAPGRYEAAAAVGVANPINALQEVWAKMIDGYFGRGFSAAWQVRLREIAGGNARRAEQIRAGLDRAGPAVRQFALLARPDFAAGMRPPHFSEYELGTLLDVRFGRSHTREPDGNSFLAGLFFRDSVLDRGATREAAMRFQATGRTLLLSALQHVSARFQAAIHSLGWSGLAWAEFLRCLIRAPRPSVDRPSSWRDALLPDQEARGRLIGDLRIDSPSASGVLPPAIAQVRDSADPVRSMSTAARNELDAALDLVLVMTADVLGPTTPRDIAETPLHDHVLLFILNPRGGITRVQSSASGEELSSLAEVDLRVHTLPHARIDPSRSYAQGNWVQARYEYLRTEGGQSDRLVFQLDFMHMTSVERVRDGQGAAEPGLVTADSPLLGTIGSSGNANTPHAHMQIVVKEGGGPRGSLDRGPPLAVVSIFDFLGHLPWLGPIATGPWPIP